MNRARSGQWAAGVLAMTGVLAIARGEPVPVTFVVSVETQPAPQAVYLAGNHPHLGNWRADGVPLEPNEGGRWTKTLRFEPGTRLEFKVTRGTWAREALDDAGRVPPNRVVEVSGPDTVSVRVTRWKGAGEGGSFPGGVTGTLEIHRDFEGEGLVPRDVLVWMPPGYAEHPDRRYPVLYMHDGQQVFDPATSTQGVDWQVDERVTELAEAGRMQEILVVATTSTPDRAEEYDFGGERASAYRAFLAGTLKPFIDETYRTLPGREHTAVMGASLGGTASFLMVYDYPEIFSMAGCLSSAFFFDLTEIAASSWPEHPVLLYLDNGGVGLERVLQPGNDWMLEVLEGKGFRMGKDLVWFRDPAAEHNEAAWARRVHMPLRMFFGIGEQPWIRELPGVPEPVYAERDREPPEQVNHPRLRIVGIEGPAGRRVPDGAGIDTLWARFRERLENDAGFARGLDARRPVGVLIGSGENAGLRYLAGAIVRPDAPASRGGVVMEVNPAEYTAFPLTESNASFAETYRYARYWWLPREGLRMTGPVLHWRADPDGPPTLLAPVAPR